MRLSPIYKSGFARNLAVIGICLVLFASCAKVDLNLGEDMIPDKSKMKIQLDTLRGIRAYTRTVDSLITSRWSQQYLGSVISAEFGRTKCDMVAQYIFNGFKSDSMWGDEPTIDSVVLTLQVNQTIGDSNYYQTISMFDLDKSLPSTNNFTSDFDLTGYLAPEPVSVFTVRSNQKYLQSRLPISFGERFLDTTGRIYLVDSLFYAKFPGSYFRVNDNTNEGSIFELDLTNSKISIYYHNKNKPTPDTSSLIMLYSNDITITSNKSFTKIYHDFSLADPVRGINQAVINDTLNSYDVTYVQGMGGLMTQLEILPEQIDKIKEKVKAQGYSSIIVNNAMLYIRLNDPTAYSMDNALGRLGMFYNYQNLRMIPDYNPYIESSDYQAPFDGYLDRALEGYKMDITTYVQYLFSGKTENNKPEIASSIGYEQYPIGCFIDNSSKNPLELAITYTMIK